MVRVFLLTMGFCMLLANSAFANSLVAADIIGRSSRGGSIDYELKTKDRTLTFQASPGSERAKQFDEALLMGKKVYITLSDDGDIVRVLIGMTASTGFREQSEAQ